MWTCPRCREDSDESFEICWNCGTARSGELDPDFMTADESAVLPDPPGVPGEPDPTGAAKPAWAFDDGDDFAGVAPVDLVECYWARDEIEARYLAESLAEQGIPAVADADVMRMGLGVAALGAPYFSPRVRVRAEDLARARSWLRHYESRRRSRARREDEPDQDDR